jgi:hypothetical protein
LWQRWQKRAISRTAAPHFGHFTVACCAGVIDNGFVGLGTGGELAAVPDRVDLSGRVAGGCATPTGAFGCGRPVAAGCAAVPFFAVAAPFGVPPACPGDEFSAIANFSGHTRATSVQRSHVRSQRYPVRRYRCFRSLHDRRSQLLTIRCESWVRLGEHSAMRVFARHPKPYGLGGLRLARQRRNQRDDECN